MNFIETIKETIQRHNISSIKKQHLLLAYLQYHLLNPGLHPDDYLTDYQGWAVLLVDKVWQELIINVPDTFRYPTAFLKIEYVLQTLEEEFDSNKSSVDELDLLSTIHTIQNWLEDMKPSDLEGTVQLLQELYLSLADESESDEGKPAGVLKEAADVLNWVLTK